MVRLLGFVIFDTKSENITVRNYDINNLIFKVICIPSIEESAKQKLSYLAKEIIRTLNYNDFDKIRKEEKKVMLSMLYNPNTNKAEIYSTGIIKNKLSNPHDTFLQKQVSIALDYFSKNMIQREA